MVSPLVDDTSWVQQSFLVNAADLQTLDQTMRYFTTAAYSIEDTKPGGSRAINPAPQFTRNADIRVTTKLKGSSGLGRYYHEAIAENQQVIYMRMGVPAYNALSTFFTGFYDSRAGQLARTGRADSSFYNLGLLAGMVIQVLNWQLLAIHLLGTGVKYLAGIPQSKFYYLKPAMPMYWTAVQTMVNQMAVNRGIVPRIGGTQALNDIGQQDSWSASDLAKFASIMPDIFKENGQIDVYSLATRYMRIDRAKRKYEQDLLNGNTTDIDTIISTIATATYSDSTQGYQAYMSSWLNATVAQPSAQSDASTTGSASDATSNSVDSTTESITDSVDQDNGFWSFLAAELDDGGAFAGFKVNYTGSTSESFSTSTSESDIAQKINSASASARNMKFDLAGGNFGSASDGIVGAGLEGIQKVVGAAGDVVSGIADSLHVSGLASLGGAALVDIPKKWDSSSSSIFHANYTVELRSPYGNPISQLINIYIPLAMLLATTLPLSTGKQSYTSPFLVELYDKGRQQTRLGIVTSMTVTRGVGNFGFNRDGHAMGIDVSFSIEDLSTIMHMPIAQGMSLAGAAATDLANATGSTTLTALAAATTIPGFFDDQTVFSDYMAVLAGMGMSDQIYASKRLKLNLTEAVANAKSFFTTSHMAAAAGDTLPGRLMGMFFRGIDK